MSDLAIIDPSEALDRATDPGEFVVMALERGKSWLAEALAHGDLEALVNAKGYAATLRVAVMQKQLGHDAELSATELVRRAERCIGLGIRQGQEAGEIRTGYDNLRNVGDHDHVTDKRSPVDFATRGELGGSGGSTGGFGIYDLTDNVSDGDFEEALADAKAEGNLSRANLVRKVKPDKAAPKPSDRSEWHRKTRRIDVERIVEQTVIALEGLALGLALIDDYTAIEAEKRLLWLDNLREPLAAINRMRKGLSG